jgi:hypothetical protein
MKWLKVSRGVLGTAATWAVAWGAVAVLLRAGRVLLFGEPITLSRLLAEHTLPALQYGLGYGAVLGAGFAIAVALLGRRARGVGELSMPLVALAGAVVAGALHSWVIGGVVFDAFVPVSLVLGAGTAAGTLAAARRAERLGDGGSGQERLRAGSSLGVSASFLTRNERV